MMINRSMEIGSFCQTKNQNDLSMRFTRPTAEKARLTKKELTRVKEWLNALGCGMMHDGTNVRCVGATPLSRVNYERHETHFSDCLYAICGNTSLRLRAKGKNGNVL